MELSTEAASLRCAIDTSLYARAYGHSEIRDESEPRPIWSAPETRCPTIRPHSSASPSEEERKQVVPRLAQAITAFGKEV